MTFTDAIDIMSTSTSRNAAKRGMMGGYIWKFAAAKNGLPELTDEGDFRLSLVQRDGDQFIFTWDESEGAFTYNGYVAHGSNNALDNTTSPSASTTLVLDAELMLHIARGSDWSIGAQTSYEDARTGDGEW